MSDTEKTDRSPGFWVPTLYTAEGLPFVGVVVVSVMMYKSMGLKDGDIAFFTTVVTLPWSLKPLWSPFLEMFKTKKYFVLATQFLGGVLFGLLVLSLAPLLGSEIPIDRSAVTLSLVAFGLIAFNSATHDIVADGIYIDALTPTQQAQFSGWQGAFYNVGKLLAQGVLVWVAGQLENSIGVVAAWMIVMGAFGAILALIGAYHVKLLPTGRQANPPSNLDEAYATFFDILRLFLRKKLVLWGMLFVVLYRFSEGQQVKIVPLFFRAERTVGGLGLTTQEMGFVYGTAGAAAFIFGSILGGYFVANRGLRKSLLTLCALFNLPLAVYAVLAFTTPERFDLICAAVIFEWFGYGFGFVGITLFMMQQIAPGPFKMAHYAFATALMNIGFMVPSAFSGFLSDLLGYKNFFLWVMIATIPSFFVAWKVPFKDQHDFEEEEREAREANTYERAPRVGATAIVVAVLALFTGLGLSIADVAGVLVNALYGLSFASLGLTIWWFKSPYVALRGNRLRLSLTPLTSLDIEKHEIAEASFHSGVWELGLSTGKRIQVFSSKVQLKQRKQFEEFTHQFSCSPVS